MSISRRGALDAGHLDSVLTLDVERGVAAIDLAQVSFVDAYALAGLACFIASAARDGLPVELVVPEDPDVRTWLSRMHLGDVLDSFEVRVEGGLPSVAERDLWPPSATRPGCPRSGSSSRSGMSASGSGIPCGLGTAT